VPKRPEIPFKDFAEALGAEPVASIPFDPQLFGMAANNGQMIAEADPRSPIAESFNQIAQVVTGRSEAKRQKRSVIAPLLARLRGAKSA
jgi:pilus assembly protein CpaE